MANVVLVVAGGNPPEPEVVASLPRVAAVICADKGIEHALANGWHIDACVGDFDSVSPEVLAEVEASDTEVYRFPFDKDKTDLALALELACEQSCETVVVIGIGGGRLDHLFANLNLLGNPEFSGVEIVALVGSAKVSIIHDSKTLVGTPGEVLSLFALNGDAAGVTTTGLRYVLDRARLRAGSSLGVSNELTEKSASVEVDEGVLMVIQPNHLGKPAEGRTADG